MHLFKNPPVDVGKAIQIAAPLNKQPYMLVVDASRPWKSVAELTAYLKDKKDKASYATTNPPAKVMGAIYKARAGLQAVEVPYRTAFDTVNDMQSGALDYALYDPVFATTQAREGRMRILAVSTGERTKANPELPTDDGVRRADGSARLVRRHGADGNAAPGRRSAQQVVQRPRRDRREPRNFSTASAAIRGSRRRMRARRGFCGTSKDWGEYVRTANIEPQG